MPIEIKELHIKINVDGEKNERKPHQNTLQINKQEVIAHCVERVMEIIDNKVER